MKHTFEYMYKSTALDSINIDNIAQLSINFLNDIGQEWFLNVKTDLGNSVLTVYGPLLVDSNELQSFFDYHREEFVYNEKKIIRTIDKYLNNPTFAITQVIEIDEDIFNSRLEGVIDDSYQQN